MAFGTSNVCGLGVEHDPTGKQPLLGYPKAVLRHGQLLAEIGSLGFYDTADALMKDEILLAPEQMRRVLSPPFRGFRGPGLQRLDSGPNFDHEARLTLRLASQHRE